MDSTGQNQEPGGDLKSENVPAPANSSSHVGHDGTVEQVRKVYTREPPVYEFHFPDEVWEVILNMLTKDEDRTNCCRAFPVFDRLLTKSKPVWMFKEILPILFGPISCDYGHYGLKINDLLNCRRMCKQWCDDIDREITILSSIERLKCADNWYLFDSVEKIDSFNQTFHAHSGNPFINKRVTVQYLGDQTEEFDLKLIGLFYIHGGHIQTLEFHWADFPSEDLPYTLYSYLWLWQALTKTPNLMTLELWANWESIPVEVKDEYFSALDSLMMRHPLPPLPKLHTLEVYSMEVPDSLIKMLVLKYMTHLERLYVESGVFSQIVSPPCYFLKLEYLTIGKVSNDQHLEKLLLLTAPIKQLKVLGPAPGPGAAVIPYINISVLLPVSQNFPLLEEVTIYDCFIKTPLDFAHHSSLSTPLRRLTLEFWRWNDILLPKSYNFLQVFDGLEVLYVSLGSPRETYLGRNEGEKQIQLYKMLEGDQLYESNIWSIIPSLKTVHIYCALNGTWKMSIKGNRKGFEEHQAASFKDSKMYKRPKKRGCRVCSIL